MMLDHGGKTDESETSVSEPSSSSSAALAWDTHQQLIHPYFVKNITIATRLITRNSGVWNSSLPSHPELPSSLALVHSALMIMIIWITIMSVVMVVVVMSVVVMMVVVICIIFSFTWREENQSLMPSCRRR